MRSGCWAGARCGTDSRAATVGGQQGSDLLLDFLTSLRILQTRSPLWKLLGRTFVLYHLATRSLHAASWILLLSRSSLMRSNPTARLSWFMYKSKSCHLMDDSPTSIRIMASVSYMRLYGVSCVVVWGVHRYAHMTSNSSSVHLPFATPSLFFNSFKRTLLATSTWPFVWGCSTKLVTNLIPRSP